MIDKLTFSRALNTRWTFSCGWLLSCESLTYDASCSGEAFLAQEMLAEPYLSDIVETLCKICELWLTYATVEGPIEKSWKFLYGFLGC